MAAAMRGLMRLNVNLASNTLLRNNLLNSCRFLYTEQSLGMQGYENSRLNFRNQFLNVENTFRTKMQEVCDTESSMIFTEDLKSMLHLAQKKPEDIELLVKMLTKFNVQNKDLRFGTFIFGPVVMRTFYYLDEPDLALTAFKDPQFGNFFEQLISYQILLCLLYKHEKYIEMREVYDLIKNKYLDGALYPRNALILVMAACYKEDTPETLEYALNIWRDLNKRGEFIMRRAATFLTALAINQNMPHIAVEIVTAVRESRYIDIRCLKVTAYTELKRFTEIVPIFRSSLEYDRPNSPKECYFSDVIEKLESAMAQENIVEDFELYKLITLLKNNNRILPETLERHLCAEIRQDAQKRKQRNQEMQGNFFPQRRQLSVTRSNRPVLRELL
ncbi:PREDICTED: pentatricopeptide repeat-containing protein 2, mitochondrial-like [Dinoponera quadriceps]|uniref:Pentatricopeptide repeat-containing protein 2, mitochondrial-like n=1 Tax=Dinoponera quadriceps TaxID=609295 RepID=A0A6P3Y3Q8_DINQU|nr:PREDICTED: pentatricopeptide repeat-containing protein 2, mitochondrial-like [Dinoponera quadriceps]